MNTNITDMNPDELRAELRTAREVNRDLNTAATALARYVRDLKQERDECRKSHDAAYGILRQVEKDRDAAIARMTDKATAKLIERCDALEKDLDAAKAINNELCSRFVAVPEWCKLPWAVTDDGIEDATEFMVVELPNTRTARHIVACVNAMEKPYMEIIREQKQEESRRDREAAIPDHLNPTATGSGPAKSLAAKEVRK